MADNSWEEGAAGPAAAVAHAALRPAETGDLPLGETDLTDRQKVGVVLQGAGLLGHLEHGAWHLVDGFRDARVDGEGRLVGVRAAPGRMREHPQALLRRMLAELFGGDERVSGRGEARRAARALIERWRPSVAPIGADETVAQVLEAAPFLWERALGEARKALAACHRRGEGTHLWVAGPGRFRDRLLARVEGAEELACLLAGDAAAELFRGGGGDPRALAAAGRWGAAVAAWEARPPADGEERLEMAAALYALGRFGRAVEVLGASRSAAALVLRLRCQVELGSLGAARATLRRLEEERLAPAAMVEVAEAASRLLANGGEPERAREWIERALAAGARGGPALAARAALLAAGAAWDRGDREAMDRHLEAAREEAAGDAEIGWRWNHARGLRAMAAGDGAAVAASVGAALRNRRRLLRHQAAGLWNDLGLGRAQCGDLAGAERAFRASLRLFRGCDGPRRTTLASLNLAEVRLRRGELAGVREILEQSIAENRLSGNLRGLTQDTELWARFELVVGRPGAALALCRDATARLDEEGIDWRRAELATLAARALGWLGRPAEAAAELARAGDAAGAELEPEEIPALFAHAGRRDEALARAAGTPWERLWRAALDPAARGEESDGGDEPQAALAHLEPYRAARLVFDLQLAAPGAVAPAVRRQAAAELARAGAGLLAERLAAGDEGPWQALAAFLGEPGAKDALPRLFAAAGYPAASLALQRDDGEDELLVAGDGRGGETAERDAAGGRLVLSAPRIDAPLRALLAAAAATLPAAPRVPAPARRGDRLAGESPALLQALARADRLAASDLPILVLGESGTGKELVARRVHRGSRRARAAFLPVNCAALSETLLLSDLFGHQRGAFTGADRERAGVFESAAGGTVFLDEIGDLPPAAQGMLLRVLQEGEVRRLGESLPRRVDVRVVAATHRDLAAMVAAGSFRQDLFYRLKVGSVELPPLRERGRDAVILAERFLAERGEGAPPPQLSRAAAARLLAHSWPGNVRELQNVLAVAALLAQGGTIEPEHLDLPAGGGGREGGGYHQQIDVLRRRLVSDALAASGGNQAAAARRLGVSRQALSYLVRQLRLLT